MAHTCFTRMQKYCAAYVGYDVLRDTIVVTAPTALKNEKFFWHNILPESWIIKRYKSWSILHKYSNIHLYLENKLIFSHEYLLTIINNYHLSLKFDTNYFEWVPLLVFINMYYEVIYLWITLYYARSLSALIVWKYWVSSCANVA